MTHAAQDIFCHDRQSITASILKVQFGAAVKWLRLAYGVYRQRRQLARLDNTALRDLGISRDAAQHEAARPFWDIS